MVPVLFDLSQQQRQQELALVSPDASWAVLLQLQPSQLPRDICCGRRVVSVASGGEQGTGLDRMEDGALPVPHPQVTHRWAAAVHRLNRNVLSSSHVPGTVVFARDPAVTRTDRQSCHLGSLRTINVRYIQYFEW